MRVALYVIGLAIVTLGVLFAGWMLPSRPSDLALGLIAAGCALLCVASPDSREEAP